MYTHEAINRSLKEFFGLTKSVFEDCPENRAVLQKEITRNFDGEFTGANVRKAAESCASEMRKAKPIDKPKLPVVNVDRAVWDKVCQAFPWMDRGDDNVLIVCDWLQHNSDGAFSLNNISGAVVTLGKSALASPVPVAPAPVVVAPPIPPRPKRFNWDSIGTGEIPLHGPDGALPPEDFLRRASREQLKSLVQRQERVAKPWLTDFPGSASR